MARPELLERRPSWPVPLRLEPLHPGEREALIGDAVGEKLRGQIARRRRREPALHHGDGRDGEEGVVPNVPEKLKIQRAADVLIEARLDQLSQERRVLESGAIEGEIFHRGAVQELTPEESQVRPLSWLRSSVTS